MMAPVIRVDEQVMEELKKRAVVAGLVFSTPNEVLRQVLGLGETGLTSPASLPPDSTSPTTCITVVIKNMSTARRDALIIIPKDMRKFFPGYKIDFEMYTDVGPMTMHVTSAPKGALVGDPEKGGYLMGQLGRWFKRHPELRDGAELGIEALQPGKRYQLSINKAGP